MRSEQGWRELDVRSRMREKHGMVDHRMLHAGFSLYLEEDIKEGCVLALVEARSKIRVLEEVEIHNLVWLMGILF